MRQPNGHELGFHHLPPPADNTCALSALSPQALALSAPSTPSGEGRRFAFVELRVGASAHVELRVIPVPPRTQAARTCGSGGAPPATVGARGEPLPGARVEVFWTDEGQWFAGTAGVTRVDGATRVVYDPCGQWTRPSDLVEYHILHGETWRFA